MSTASPGATRHEDHGLCKGLLITLLGSIYLVSSAQAQSAHTSGPSSTVKSHPDKVRAKHQTQNIGTAERLSQNIGTNEVIVITGTRLTQSHLTNVMADSSLSGEQIKKIGYYDLGTALMRENPAVSQGGNSPLSTQNPLGAGQSFVELLNLGAQRTLTLIDGMRMSGGATASIYGAGPGSQVDVSTIPTSLIKSVDINLGGAGAAYGADAVAGVMNYRLDDRFTGVDFSAQGNWSQRYDAPGQKITFKTGAHFDHNRGGLVFDVEYRSQGGMTSQDRPNIFGRDALSYHPAPLGETSLYSFVLGPATRYYQNAMTGLPMVRGDHGILPVFGGTKDVSLAGQTNTAVSTGTTPLIFSHDGKTLVPLSIGTPLKSDDSNGAGGNGIALRDYYQLIVPNEKFNLTLLGHEDFTDHIHARWQGWHARGSAENQVSQGTWSSTLFENPLTLNKNGPRSSSYYTDQVVNGALALRTDNPYLTRTERKMITRALAANNLPTDIFYLNRLNQDLDSGLFRTSMQMYHFQGGLDGDFRVAHRTAHWAIRGEYTQYRNDTWTPSIVIPNLVNALNAVRNSNGSIICKPGYITAPVITRSTTCEPLNPFGSNQMTSGARDYVIADAHSRNNNTQRDLQAELSSILFHLPAGPVLWDLGYEHRRESDQFDPGTFYRGWQQKDGSYRQYGSLTTMPPTDGAYLTHEVLGELDIPLVSPDMQRAGIHHLSATANGRFISNSIAGRYWTYMFGAAWWPIRDVGLSGNYARSVRNPSVSELFSPRSTSYEGGIDPCSATGLGSGPNPAQRAANCALAGLNQSFISSFNSTTIQGTAGSNPHLNNEVSKSFTGSIELRPHRLNGLDLKTSFVDVTIRDAITYLAAQDLLNACYDSSSYPSNVFCGTFTRDAAGQVSEFDAGYYNIASYKTQALEATIDYAFALSRLGLGEETGNLDIRGNYLHYIRSQNSYLGKTYLLSGRTGTPNDNMTLDLDYMRAPFSAQWQTLWYGPTYYQIQVPTTRYQENRRPPFATFNFFLSYRITKILTGRFVINNVTGALPRYPGTYDVNRYYSALIGRNFQLTIGVHF